MAKKQTDYQRYIKALFLPGELLCVTNDVTGTSLTPFEQAIEAPPTNFVCINPLRESRLDANVTQLRNFLFEFDEGTLEEQLATLVRLKVPYTTLVYSGGKSLHAIIALDEPVTREEYDEIFKLVRYVLPSTDPTARNPSRLTRCAGANRGGVEQELVGLRRRSSKTKLFKWLSQYQQTIERAQAREAAEARRREEQRAKCVEGAGLESVDEMTLKFLNAEIGTRGSRHARLMAAAFELCECGVEYDDALTLIQQAADLHGITADPARAGEAVSITNYAYEKFLPALPRT